MPKHKILICDDSEGVRESLKLILKDEYELLFACDGNEAVRVTETESPELVLLDIKMPGPNGIETSKQIKKIKPKTKILIVTGYQYANTTQNAAQNGIIDYIIKPFEPEALKQTVKRILKTK